MYQGLLAFFRLPYVDGLSHLLFPSVCIICHEELTVDEKNCCSICEAELSYTHFEKYEEETDLDRLFWGRVPIVSSFSLLFFEKENTTRFVLHALKYKNRSDVAIDFGARIGSRLATLPKMQQIDLLIPVPIHTKKRHIRGYNQSEKLIDGIVQQFPKKVDFSIIQRKKHHQSQTKLGRFQRWDNMADLFIVNERIRNYQHIALVDDVVTTGATLEAIAQEILKIAPSIQISIISLAVAK
jgi:competence protein ComFC